MARANRYYGQREEAETIISERKSGDPYCCTLIGENEVLTPEKRYSWKLSPYVRIS
jgi:hypothetical protein